MTQFCVLVMQAFTQNLSCLSNLLNLNRANVVLDITAQVRFVPAFPALVETAMPLSLPTALQDQSRTVPSAAATLAIGVMAQFALSAGGATPWLA